MKTKNILITVAVLAVIVFYRQPISDLLHIIADQEAVSDYLQSYGAWGPAILFILMVAQVFIAVIPGHALMVTAGYVYGMTGLIVVIASTILGSQIAFSIARKYGQDLIYKLASPKIIKRWNSIASNQGIVFYFFSFVLPIFPSDLMCYVAGLGKISPRQFLLANILGRTIVAVSITVIGIYGMNPPVWFWVIAAIGVAGLFGSWVIFRKKDALQVQFAS